MQWTFGGANGTNIANNGFIVLDMMSAFRASFGAGIRDVTVQRNIGEVFLLDNGSVSPGYGTLTFGIVVASLDAFATGAGALPDPDGDSASWMYWWRGMNQPLRSADATPTTSIMSRDIVFDIKSQRKMDGMRNTLVLIIKNIAGHNVIVGGNGRLLALWNT